MALYALGDGWKAAFALGGRMRRHERPRPPPVVASPLSGALSLPLAGAACLWRPPYDPRNFSLPERSSVGLFPASDYATDFADLIFRGLRELRVDLTGRRVFLKPNMVEYEPGTAINTHPLVVAGAAIACRRAGAADVVVGEGPGHRRDIEYLLSATGLDDQLRDERIRFVDLNHDDVRMVPLRSWFTGLRELALPGRAAAVRLHHLDAEAQDASLGGHDVQHEEPVRRRAGRRLRLAEERAALRMGFRTRSST